MSFENPQNIIRSWTSQASFANGPVVQDKLVPQKFTRIRTPFVHTWREEQVASLDWGAQSYSWYLPESLRVISSIFLKVTLPAISSGSYKVIPGFDVIDRIRFLSAGQESYNCDAQQFYRDYVESLTNEEAERFLATYMGYTTDVGNGVARELLIPILLPNSAYLGRHGKSSVGHGVFPAYLGANRLECQITLKPAANLVQTGADAPASIAGSVSMMIHQVDMVADNVLRYSDTRGQYSIVSRRFTELTNGYEAATANNRVKLTQHQPLGCVTELFCIAIPSGTAAANREIHTNVKPTHFAITSDSITQKSLNTASKVNMELWNNGFIGNKFVNCPGRLCFAAHAAEAESMYTGGYNMQNSSQIVIDLEFAENVDFKVFAIQLQRVTINAVGLLQASLD